jgi:GIY-YIG catalytic domain.
LNSNLKVNIPPEKKSGIYQISCKDCDKIHIGKTKINLETRVKEHFRYIKNGEIEKLAIAAHVWKEKHAMDHKPVLLKQAANKQELTNWENTLITKKQRSRYKFWNPASRSFN